MKLFIANQNYSSWSLRAWLILAQHNLDAEITKLTLFTPEFYETLSEVTPTAKVPTLVDDNITVWDSFAILEYINEAHLDGAAWPQSASEPCPCPSDIRRDALWFFCSKRRATDELSSA